MLCRKGIEAWESLMSIEYTLRTERDLIRWNILLYSPKFDSLQLLKIYISRNDVYEKQLLTTVIDLGVYNIFLYTMFDLGLVLNDIS